MTDSKRSGVFFCPTRSWGGIEKNVRLRAKYFGEKGMHIYVVLLEQTFEDKFRGLQNVTVKTITKRGGDLNLLVVWRYFKFLRKIQPETVFAALKRDWWLVTLAARLARVPRVVLYLGNKRKIRNGGKYYLVFKVLKAEILVNSNSLKQHLLDSTPYFDEHNLHRIYNGIALPELNGEGRKYREALNLAKDSYIIGCAGWLNYRKGFDLLPDILRKLPEQLHVVHVGSGGLDLDVPQLIADNRDVAHRMHFLGHETEMDAFFRGIDLFLLCSRSEGMANVLNEALGHGKPIVSTRVPGSEELLDNGTYGVLTPVEDTQAMAKGVLEVYHKKITFPAEHQRLRITSAFSFERMMEATEALFFPN